MSFTILKKNPTQGEITSSLTGSTGDGAGLHFDGSAGNIDIASPPDLGTKFSFEFVIKADSTGSSSKIVDFGDGGRFVIEHNTTGLQVKPSNAGGWVTLQSPSPLADLEVHHLVLTVDGTTATLYDNGNQIATDTISATDIDSCADAKIGSYFDSATDLFNGTIYRARFYNKTLSSAEVQTAYERADVDFADQYGSQTNLVNPAANGDFSGSVNWGASGNHSISIVSGELKVVATGASTSSSNAATLAATYGGTGTNSKVYKWEFTARASSGTPTLRARTPFDHSDVTTGSYKDFTLSTSNQTFSITGKRIALENAYFGLLEAGTFFIDNIKATQIGCVSDYELSANPTQSLTVQDASGSADGTCSASGVSQVQPIIQGNLKSLAVGSAGLPAGVPADNHVFIGDTTTTPLAGADDLIIARGSNDAGVTIRTATNATGQICFADGNTGNEQYRGFIGYAHGTDKLNLGSGGSTAMTITSSGAVQIGPDGIQGDAKLGVRRNGDAFNFGHVNGAGYGSNIGCGNNNGHPYVAFSCEHGTNNNTFKTRGLLGNVIQATATGELKFSQVTTADADNQTATERLTISSTGLATFSNGINLGNTASATATTLDGYEEGTFQVTTDGDASGVLTSETGEYTRIGNCVFIRIAIRVGTNFTSNKIAGLPFSCVIDGAASGWSPIGTALTSSATNAPIIVSAQNTLSKLSFFKQASTLTTHLPSTSEDYYRVTGCYYTSDAF